MSLNEVLEGRGVQKLGLLRGRSDRLGRLLLACRRLAGGDRFVAAGIALGADDAVTVLVRAVETRTLGTTWCMHHPALHLNEPALLQADDRHEVVERPVAAVVGGRRH